MKKILFHLMLASFTFSVNAQKETREPYMTKSFANATVKDVDVKTSGGSIAVEGVSPSEARVEVYINANNSSHDISKEEIKRRLEENYDLTVSLDNNKISAIAKPKERNINWKKSLSISFKVFAPKNLST